MGLIYGWLRDRAPLSFVSDQAKKSMQHGQEPLDSSQLESPGYETCLPPTLANAWFSIQKIASPGLVIFSWPYDWFCHLRVVCLSADRLCSTDRWNFQGLIILGHSSWSVYAIFDPRISLSIDIHSAKDLKLHLCWAMFNGHFRNLNWRYLPYIRPI